MKIQLPFNPGNWRTQALVSLLLILLLIGFATRCHAVEPYMQIGAGYTKSGGSTVLDMAYVRPNFVKDSALEVGVTFFSPYTFNGEQGAGNFIWRAQIVDGFGRFDVGFGAAIIQHDDAFNSGKLNFALSLSYRFQRPFTLALDRHFSNGGTASPNRGRDAPVLSYRLGEH
jgi:hypothetical protein